jgi:phage gp46-like protein
MSTPRVYGVGIDVLPDLSFRRMSGTEKAVQALILRLMTPKGSLFWALEDGVDLREFVQDTWDEQTRFELETFAANEIAKDERVEEFVVTASQIDLERVRLRVEGRLAEGPFSFVLNISQVSVEVLRGNAG